MKPRRRISAPPACHQGQACTNHASARLAAAALSGHLGPAFRDARPWPPAPPPPSAPPCSRSSSSRDSQGLIYQSIWSHYLGLFVGHAAYAQALVLAIFMGGMALGAALVARVGEGWRNLVRGYALVEGLIGLAGLAFHAVFVFAVEGSYDAVIPALGHPALIAAWKWGLAALLILPQSILLGMTFPLMSGGIIRRWPGTDGDTLGGLYFTNSIGAAAGALISTFVLLPRIGLDGAVFTAGLLNLAVAALAWLLGSGREAPRPPAPELQRDPAGGRPLLVLVLGATALSGAASFVYEIAFVRMLSLAVGNTLHAFEIMLASFIAGIAFGGLWVRRRADRSRNPLILVGWMQVLMGLAALLSLLFYAHSFEWVGALMNALAKSDGGYTLFNFGTAALAILIMLPPAFFAGTTLPLFTVALLRAGFGEGAIGRVYAWNTLGAILGVAAAVHVLIPGLGLKLALCFAAFVDMLIGLVLAPPGGGQRAGDAALRHRRRHGDRGPDLRPDPGALRPDAARLGGLPHRPGGAASGQRDPVLPRRQDREHQRLPQSQRRDLDRHQRQDRRLDPARSRARRRSSTSRPWCSPPPCRSPTSNDRVKRGGDRLRLRA
ncbi:MAG: fused MFS/spermidine synthase [Xanthomonadales bacterium]|nr:fused MFS/spermidine synthase [Xanthomonadales bacterium]